MSLDSSTSAAMRPVGHDAKGRPLYYAEPGQFDKPGLYVWDDAKNENVLLWAADGGFVAPPVAGYNSQNQIALDCVNAMKHREELVLQQLDFMKEDPEVDQRWLAIGRTHLEQAFMAINRSIFKPGRVKLGQ